MAAADATDYTTTEEAMPNTISHPLETNGISLDEAQELVHIGSWQWSVATGAIVWSDELFRIYGLKPRKQALGFEAFVELIHPDDREKVTNIINEAYQTKQSFEFEHRIVLPNKKIRILYGKGKVISDSTGNVSRMLGTSQDVTERKKADQALHRSNERFNAVSAATNDVVYDIDLQTGTVWFNGALNGAYKYPKRKAAAPLRWRLDRIHPYDQERIEASIDAWLKGRGKTWVGEYRFRKHDGAYVDVRDRAFVLRDTERKPIRIIGSMLDITQQKELERAKDRFISLVSHQLRTPLTSMRLLTEMLANGHLDALTAAQQDCMEKIEASTVRMIRLVNEILSVSSLETGRLNVQLVKTNVNAVIQAQIDEVMPLAAERGIAIEFKTDAKIDVATIDPMLFSQIVHNLLTNAVRYTMKKGAAIRVTFQRTDQEYLLVVHDQGIGIPKEAQSHIFSSFYRANNAIKAQGDGTGLGLYLTKLILDMTGGSIRFESQEKKGSTFYVSLPLGGMKNNQGSKVAV